MKRSDFVYLAITPDEYELPIAIFESPKEMAEWANRDYTCVCAAITRQRVDQRNHCKYIKVCINEKYNDIFAEEDKIFKNELLLEQKTNEDKAKKLGISLRTYYRRKNKNLIKEKTDEYCTN